MKVFLLAAAAVVGAGGSSACAQADLAPTGTLRAAYLGTNPAQAMKDPQTGELRGASLDLARELAKRIGKPLNFKPIPNPPAVVLLSHKPISHRPARCARLISPPIRPRP